MQYIRRKCNLLVDLSKFITNNKILSNVVILANQVQENYFFLQKDKYWRTIFVWEKERYRRTRFESFQPFILYYGNKKNKIVKVEKYIRIDSIVCDGILRKIQISLCSPRLQSTSIANWPVPIQLFHSPCFLFDFFCFFKRKVKKKEKRKKREPSAVSLYAICIFLSILSQCVF